MQFRFNQEVRKAVSEELRKVSTYGGIALGALGYSTGAPETLAGAFVWWVGSQALAMYFLGLEDEQ